MYRAQWALSVLRANDVDRAVTESPLPSTGPNAEEFAGESAGRLAKRLLNATPEMKTVKRDGVKPNSPRWIQLRTAAATRVRKACEKARGRGKFCSVWKRITRRDNGNVPDITAAVKRELQMR